MELEVILKCRTMTGKKHPVILQSQKETKFHRSKKIQRGAIIKVWFSEPVLKAHLSS